MRIYLDTCSLQRPLDSKTLVRNRLEAEAVLLIIALCETGKAELISSEALLFETRRTPSIARQEFAFQMLGKAAVFVKVRREIRIRAEEIIYRRSDAARCFASGIGGRSSGGLLLHL